jgi:hypothetical protein
MVHKISIENDPKCFSDVYDLIGAFAIILQAHVTALRETVKKAKKDNENKNGVEVA